MNISGVVHQESHGGGKTVGFGVTLDSVALNLLILVIRGIIVLLIDPVLETGDGLGDVVGIWNEVWVVRDVIPLIEIWGINEMPSGLVGATFVLNVVSESDTFDEGVVALLLGPAWVRLLEHVQDLLNGVDGVLIEQLVSNSGDEEMAISPPGVGLADESKGNERSFHNVYR